MEPKEINPEPETTEMLVHSGGAARSSAPLWMDGRTSEDRQDGTLWNAMADRLPGLLDQVRVAALGLRDDDPDESCWTLRGS